MRAILTLVDRELVRFYRQPSRVIGALVTPLLFWLLIGGGLGASFRPGGGAAASPGGGTAGAAVPDFMEYFYPGTLVLIVFFTAIFSTISVIEDRKEGFLQGVLIAPVSRLSLAAGKILGGATLAVLQGAIFLLLAPLAGIPLTPGTALAALASLVIVAVGLTGLGFIIAWMMDSTQGFHAIMNVFLIPLWLLSGAAFPASGARGWLRIGMALNPVSYGVALVRHALYAGRTSEVLGAPPVLTALIVTAVFAVVMAVGAAWVAHHRTASHG